MVRWVAALGAAAVMVACAIAAAEWLVSTAGAPGFEPVPARWG